MVESKCTPKVTPPVVCVVYKFALAENVSIPKFAAAMVCVVYQQRLYIRNINN